MAHSNRDLQPIVLFVLLQMVTTLAKFYRLLMQELHLQMRQVVQYISNKRNNHDLRIYEGINIERLYGAGMQPFTYNSYDDTSRKCLHRIHTWASLKSQLYPHSTAKRCTSTTTTQHYLLLHLLHWITFTYAIPKCLDTTTRTN